MIQTKWITNITKIHTKTADEVDSTRAGESDLQIVTYASILCSDLQFSVMVIL